MTALWDIAPCSVVQEERYIFETSVPFETAGRYILGGYHLQLQVYSTFLHYIHNIHTKKNREL
jgi:hypothetical protein